MRRPGLNFRRKRLYGEEIKSQKSRKKLKIGLDWDEIKCPKRLKIEEDELWVK